MDKYIVVTAASMEQMARKMSDAAVKGYRFVSGTFCYEKVTKREGDKSVLTAEYQVFMVHLG